jgi:hypothetical protein
MGHITTRSGIKFDYEKFKPEDIVLEDIFHALSQTARFAGHCSRFYSVAEHSCAVALQMPQETRIYGLMHDGSEAYMTDIPTPLKLMCPGYREIEKRIQDAIYKKFCGGLPTDEVMEQIHMADRITLRWEAYHLVEGRGGDWAAFNGLPPMPEKDKKDPPPGFAPPSAQNTMRIGYEMVTKRELI